MSFDLYFCRRDEADVSPDELRQWIAKHQNFSEYAFEGKFRFDYENEDTGVNFSIAHGFPDWLPGGSREEGELPLFRPGVFPVGIDVRLNICRPSYYAHEAMPLMVDLADSFDLMIGNPQDRKSEPDSHSLVTYMGLPPSDGAEEGSVESDHHWEDGVAPPRFPEHEMEPRLYSSAELIADWERMNSWSIYNVHQLVAERGGELPAYLRLKASRQTSMGFWRYMRLYRALKDRYEPEDEDETEEFTGYAVRQMWLVIRPGSDQVKTAMAWSGPCGQILPPVDYFVIPRWQRLRKRFKGYLVESHRVLDILEPYLEPFDEVEGAFAVSDETLVNLTDENGRFEEAVELAETVKLPRKDAEFEFVAPGEFIDVDPQPVTES
ncbi:MAG: hypothetical protein IH903_05045 [Proteobacteria bacterium]|nr:hypothetical protein [Pseudomonadota bacterium]